MTLVEFLSGFFGSLLPFLLLIGVCVLVHEWGHFATARLFDVQVHEFAFGMGPVLWQRRKKETLWSVRAFPIGGFVRLAGMGEEKPDEVEDPSRRFNVKPAWQRFFILLNGALLNVVLAILLTTMLLAVPGVNDVESTVVGGVVPGFPAETWGIREGDRILSVDGHSYTEWVPMAEAIRRVGLEREVAIVVDRGGETLTFTGRLGLDAETKSSLLGIRPAHVVYPVHEAFSRAFVYTFVNGWKATEFLFTLLRDAVLGRAQMEGIGGPVAIAQMAGEAAKDGFWPFINLLMIINLQLGVLNLFPFPALDGGRLLFVTGEILTRRRLPERFEQYIHLGGMIVLLALIVFITWHDVVRLLHP